MKKKRSKIPKAVKIEPQETIIPTSHLYIGLIFLILIAFTGYTILNIVYQLKPVQETPSSQVKTIPADVKKALSKQKVVSNSPVLRVPILIYHYVEYVQDTKDTIRQSLNINPNTFETQVKTLKDAGYTFMTANDLSLALDNKLALPEKPILLTFDDGHWDLDTVVLPILKKYQVKATAYIITGFIGGSDFMTSTQLNDVISSGLVEIGAHTVHHIALKGRLSAIVSYEIGKSKRDLEQKYNLNVTSFAYPDGSFDIQAINVVKAVGFTTAVSTIPGINQSQQNRFFLYRIHPGYRSGKELLDYLNQDNFMLY